MRNNNIFTVLLAVISLFQFAIRLCNSQQLAFLLTTYDLAPKIRLRFTQFPELSTLSSTNAIIHVALRSSANTELLSGENFTASVVVQRSIVELHFNLLPESRWTVFTDDSLFSETLFITTIMLEGTDTNTTIPLDSPLAISNIIRTPTIEASDETIDMRKPALRISGTGLIGASGLSLYFNPPIYKDIAYVVDERFPLSNNNITLRLHSPYTWRPVPGDLYIVGVDTGAGPVRLGDREGLHIATVVQSSTLPVRLTVESNPDNNIYNNENYITIRGTGFGVSAEELVLSFSSNITRNKDYTVDSMNETAIVLKLRSHHTWLPAAVLLDPFSHNPLPLILISIQVSGSPAYTGPDHSGKGTVLASVHLRPFVFPTNTTIHRSESPTLVIQGIGFVMDSTTLVFKPPLIVGIDYELSYLGSNDGIADDDYEPVDDADATSTPQRGDDDDDDDDDSISMKSRFPNDSSKLVLRLLPGRVWRSDPGPLFVVAVSTLAANSTVGLLPQPGTGTQVAVVVDSRFDDDATVEPNNGSDDVSNGSNPPPTNGPIPRRVFISASRVRIYDNALNFTIIGNNFSPSMTVGFSTSPPRSDDFAVIYISTSQLMVTLLQPEARWCYGSCVLAVDRIIDRDNHAVLATMLVPVATVLMVPVVYPSEVQVYQKQTKFITIAGEGFTSMTQMNVVGTSGQVKLVKISHISLPNASSALSSLRISQLGRDEKWDLENTKLYVDSINTGAGFISLISDSNKHGIVIGTVIRDDYSRLCTDSCEFAFDGVCDNDISTTRGEFSRMQDYLALNAYPRHQMSKMRSSLSTADDRNRNADQKLMKFNMMHMLESAVDSADDYYSESSPNVLACVQGTDCTDCGGIEAYPISLCSNSCPYARDGVCDDSRGAGYCSLGTDCQDCGPVGATNFTFSDDDHSFNEEDDDDGDFFNVDPGILNQTWGPDYNADKIVHRVWDNDKIAHNDDVASITPADKVSTLSFFAGIFYFFIFSVVMYIFVVAGMMQLRKAYRKQIDYSGRENQIYTVVPTVEDEEDNIRL